MTQVCHQDRSRAGRNRPFKNTAGTESLSVFIRVHLWLILFQLDYEGLRESMIPLCSCAAHLRWILAFARMTESAVGGKRWSLSKLLFVLFVSSVVNSYLSGWILACARMTEREDDG